MSLALKSFGTHPAETLLLGTTLVVTVGGFWNIYFGQGSGADPYHHLHIITIFIWLSLLLCQLSLIGSGRYATHRKLGLSVLAAAPLLVATTALLSVHSAHIGLVSGQGDFMIVQNVMGTLQLALIILLAFALKKRRKLHASFLMSTALLFLGIAIFFSLIGFVPGFRIEGPETFHRFGKALATTQYVSLAIGALLFLMDRRSGWPYLLVGASFLFNELLKSALAQQDLIQPLTEVVGSISQSLVFSVTLVSVFILLMATGLRLRSLRAHPPWR